ncbi:hypothetical protein WA026_000259 [Henosepilachna vigintioctopunctata]|uniref:Dynein regulatory complex subunit 2 n=1 Tax=Henosepilachna vigintioctopunctata TaxID=420089 RepID=A0AAW1V3M2_9CUCU
MGKKKKSKGSKLLRMSDEEKARYLQHKVEQEQEAKRRREQLIKAWMMKKIKKEQAFARLNLAKINMCWHQLLRKKKIEGMKKDIVYMQEWLDFILTLKNRIINNLMEELEEAEAQYSYNFKAHCLHIDNFIDFHNTWVSELDKEFEEDRDDLIDIYGDTMTKYDCKFKDNCDYLKTIIFAQNKNAQAEIKEDYEYFMKKHYEEMKNVS